MEISKHEKTKTVDLTKLMSKILGKDLSPIEARQRASDNFQRVYDYITKRSKPERVFMCSRSLYYQETGLKITQESVSNWTLETGDSIRFIEVAEKHGQSYNLRDFQNLINYRDLVIDGDNCIFITDIY